MVSVIFKEVFFWSSRVEWKLVIFSRAWAGEEKVRKKIERTVSVLRSFLGNDMYISYCREVCLCKKHLSQTQLLLNHR